MGRNSLKLRNGGKKEKGVIYGEQSTAMGKPAYFLER
jgi:hypothetical protein